MESIKYYGALFIGIMVVCRIWRAINAVIRGANAAERLNIQMGALIGYFSTKDPMFNALLTKTEITVMGEQRTKK